MACSAHMRCLVGMVCLCLYGCASSVPPPATPPPLPLANRIAKPGPGKYATYRDSWHEWKNPRLIMSTKGIEVLISDAVHGPKVKPESVIDVLARTRNTDWPFGLVVMVVTASLDSGDNGQVERNRAVLLRELGISGVQIVWGPPA